MNKDVIYRAMNTLVTKGVIDPPIPKFKEKATLILKKLDRVFDMSQAVPNSPTFPKIRELVSSEVATSSAVSFYTDILGNHDLRNAICAFHPLGKHFSTDEIMITAGANHAMYTALTTMLNIGDSILLLEPHYFNYDMAGAMLGLRAQYHVLQACKGFLPVPEAVIGSLEKTRAKAIILITPNNPTGAKYPAQDVLSIVRWCSSHHVEVFLDETYLCFDPNHLNVNEIGKYIGQGLSIVGSFSKSHSLTGYRVGYLISGVPQLKQAQKIQDTMVICASHIGQRAAYHGLQCCSDDVKKKVAEIDQLTRIMQDGCKKLKRFSLASCGAFFGYLKHPFSKLSSEEAALELLENTGIFGLPGEVFGNAQKDFIRLSFCNLSSSDLEVAIEGLCGYDSRVN